jgi:hypothetical protein
VRHLTGSHKPPRANAPTGRADRVLVKTGAAHRFLVSESLTLPRPGERGGVPHRTLGHDWMTGCLKNIPEHVNWWEEFESSHDAPQAPHIDGAGGQSGRIGFLLAPWNSQKKKKKKIYVFRSHKVTNVHPRADRRPLFTPHGMETWP